ncbi:MAG: sigma 54-interacting transcriptional regulator [Vicinamibacterales bacterium]
MTATLGRYEALLGASEALISSRSVNELVQKLAEHLRTVVPFDDLALVLGDESDDLHLALLEPDSDSRPALEHSFEPGRWIREVWNTGKPVVLSLQEGDGLSPLARAYLDHGGRTLALLPMRTARARHGLLIFGSRHAADYSGETLLYMIHVTGHVAMAVENAKFWEASERYRKEAEDRGDRLALLLDINNLLVTRLEYPSLLGALTNLNRLVGPAMFRAVAHDYCSFALYHPDSCRLTIRALANQATGRVAHPDIDLPIDASPAGAAYRDGQTHIFRNEELVAFGQPGAPTLLERGMRVVCCVPMISPDRVLGTINFGSRNPDAFTARDVELLTQITHQISIAVLNALTYDELHRLKEQLAHTNVYLEHELTHDHGFDEIVGSSKALEKMLQAVATVAPTDATVLLLGETGTGKELVARAIHNRSRRHTRTFVRLNAAALPSTLIESEMFGYERGAFTGAVQGRVGRLQLANGGTLFLDEVGDLPLDVQPKLLRVIQEREFERLGSARTEKVDVRFIAATNRDLAAMVAARMFRDDLFYRLNVFPIHVPPLRERRDDIPALVAHFVRLYATRMHKPVTTVPASAMDALTRWHWPGNIRELQNVVERAVILARGRRCSFRRRNLFDGVRPALTPPPSLDDHERTAILDALRATAGRIGGATGAAARLGIKRTTLQSRMRKLGIRRPEF